MKNALDRWVVNNSEEHGPYACFAGFEIDVRAWSESLSLAYDELDIYTQIALFAFVSDLLDEGRQEHQTTPPNNSAL